MDIASRSRLVAIVVLAGALSAGPAAGDNNPGRQEAGTRLFADVAVKVWAQGASGTSVSTTRLKCVAADGKRATNRRCRALLHFATLGGSMMDSAMCQTERMGPEWALVTGSVSNVPVRYRVARSSSCGERMWRALLPVVATRTRP